MIKKEKRVHIISWMLEKLKSIQIWLERKEAKLKKDNPNKINFHALTPVVDVEKKTTSFYIDSLQWAVRERDCYNIALMGIYGSGKSSIIKSFLKKHSYESLTVSLANFQDKETDKRYLEKSIVQQIFYTVKESRLPSSGLKRIKNYKWPSSLLFYIGLIFSTFLLLILLKPKTLCFFKLDSIYDNYLFEIQLLALVFILVFSFFQFKKYRYLARQIGLKLNLQNAEINLPKLKGSSIINEYLDELIYFFEKNHQDIIVFEDLDRFDNIEVFSKLRELNLLLNNHEGIKRKGKVTFIYAVKDDLFGEDSKNIKTKFFDFILPVISVMNSSNSYAYFKELLSPPQLEELSESFLKNISLYINDLRILKNICNEYVVYKALIKDLQGISYSSDNFLAMIVYKNYYPSDFNKLLTDKGQLHNVLSKRYKEKLKESYIVKLESREVTLKKDLERLTDDEKVESEKFSELQNVLAKLKDLRRNKFTLAKLVTENGLIKFSEETDLDDKSINIIGDELFKYLIKNGYIDENYQLYISHYVEGGITKNDIDFVINVNEARDEELGIDFRLTFVSEIIDKIQSNRFSNHQLLNFYLVDYLVDDVSSDLKSEVFTKLSKLHTIQLNFVKEYFERGEKTFEFVSELINVNKKFINLLINSPLNIESKSKIIFDYLLNGNDPNITTALKDNDQLPDFISTSQYLMNTDNVSVNKLGEFMIKLGDIKFKELNYDISPDRLETIDKYFLFEVSLNNITVIYNKRYNSKSKDSKEDITPIFTKLSVDWNSGSLGRVVRNESFIESAYLESDIIHDEKEENLLELIDIINEYEDQDENEMLGILFEKTSTIITDLNNISNVENQKYLIQNNRIVFNWANIVSYQNHQFNESLENSKIEDELIEFIEKNITEEPLNFEENKSDTQELNGLEDEILFKFKQRVLKDERLEISTFENIVKTIDNVTIINEIEISEWNKEQSGILIEYKKINLSVEWIIYLKEQSWEDLKIKMYKLNLKELVDDFDKYSLLLEELGQILASDDLDINNQIKLFSKYDFASFNQRGDIPEVLLIFSNKYFDDIDFDYQRMLSILKFNSSEDQTLAKEYAIKLIKNIDTKEEIIEVIDALYIEPFSNLWDYNLGNTENFNSSKESREIFGLLQEREMIGKTKPLLNGKIKVFKKKLRQ